VEAVGYELVAPLVAVADKVAAALAAGPTPPPPPRFSCADMLAAPLGRAGLLFLTSRCWDQPLMLLLHARLIAALPSACLVLDYSDRLATIAPVRRRPPLKPATPAPAGGACALPLPHGAGAGAGAEAG
jgi:hypothetical protein